MRIPKPKEFRKAKDRYARAMYDLNAIRNAEGRNEQDTHAESRLLRHVPTGLYEHFKSSEKDQKFYIVLGVMPGVGMTIHPPVVQYFALYRTHAGEIGQKMMVGHPDSFLHPIDRPADHFRGSRFVLVENLGWDIATRLRRHAKALARCKNSRIFRKRFDELVKSELGLIR